MTAEEFLDRIAGCKIYYGDNAVAKCTSLTSWAGSPASNVQAVLVFLKEKDRQGRPMRIIYAGMDYYYLNGGVIQVEYETGKPDNLNNVMKSGKWCDPHIFKDIMDVVTNDYDF